MTWLAVGIALAVVSLTAGLLVGGSGKTVVLRLE